MRCISKKGSLLAGMLLTLSLVLSGCGDLKYDMVYQTDSSVSSFNVISRQNRRTATPFAANLCIVTENVTPETVNMEDAEAAVLFDVTGTGVLYAKNAYETLHPASLTKVMTALVALKYGKLDQTLTATSAVNITESGAQLCGLKAGDTHDPGPGAQDSSGVFRE